MKLVLIMISPKKWPMLLLITRIVMCITGAYIFYMVFGMQYRAGVLVADLSSQFDRNHIVQGCSLPTLMNYLEKRHADPIKDPDGGPYLLGYMGVKDIRVLQDKALIRFKISADQKVEYYSIKPNTTVRWTTPRTGL